MVHCAPTMFVLPRGSPVTKCTAADNLLQGLYNVTLDGVTTTSDVSRLCLVRIWTAAYGH